MITDSKAAYVEKVKSERDEARGEAWRLRVLLDELRRELERTGPADERARQLIEGLEI